MVGPPTSALLYIGLILVVAAERILEMVISRRNAARAFEQGGREYGASHFPWMVALHTTFLFAAPLEVLLLDRPLIPGLAAAMGLVLLGTMGLRYWVISALDGRWNTRVIVVPGLPAVTGGPFRWIRHPNYLAVILELIALPMIHTAWLTALVYTLLNAWLLKVRIGVEEQALREACDYEARMAHQPRFVVGAGKRES
jgi:methyltransferase